MTQDQWTCSACGAANAHLAEWCGQCHTRPILPAWYPDPEAHGALRWWNGREWTADRAPTNEMAEAYDQLLRDMATAQQELAEVKQAVVETRESVILQEVGVYEFRHPLDDSTVYKEKLKELRTQMKSAVKNDQAVFGATDWTVNGSATEGRKMVRDFSKLMLRAYNTEADSCVRTLKPHTLAAAVGRLDKAAISIVRLGKTMQIAISDYYHQLRIYELELTADYLARVSEEKEAARAERERLREEEKAQREFERERERLEKERTHYENALDSMRASGDSEGISEAEKHLAEIERGVQDLEERRANIRVGYVYVISNVGAFGPGVVKIGLTRRLDPMERVRELGDASVPFRFDVHALIFSKDAVGLESTLHGSLAHRRLNLVNTRREFFYATPGEVRELVEQYQGSVVSFNDVAEAVEWHESEATRQDLERGVSNLVGSETEMQPRN